MWSSPAGSLCDKRSRGGYLAVGGSVYKPGHMAPQVSGEGRNKGGPGWVGPSARKFFKTDELSFVVPYQMFGQMLERFGESFLTTRTWGVVQKKIGRSKRAWGMVSVNSLPFEQDICGGRE